MKINCGPSADAKVLLARERLRQDWENLSKWHTVFAFFPIRVGENDCRWLEYIERRFFPDFDEFEIFGPKKIWFQYRAKS